MSKTSLNWNKALLCGLLVGAFGPSVRAQTGCSIDARKQHNVALPVIDDGVMSEALAADIRRGFDLVSVQYDSSLGEQVLRKAQTQAEAEHNKCAEALALFGQGQAARTTQLDRALPLFRQSQALLLEVGTPMAQAQVHERIVMTQHLLGDDAPLKREGPAVIQEFHDAGGCARARGRTTGHQMADIHGMKSVDIFFRRHGQQNFLGINVRRQRKLH